MQDTQEEWKIPYPSEEGTSEKKEPSVGPDPMDEDIETDSNIEIHVFVITKLFSIEIRLLLKSFLDWELGN